MRTSLDMEKVSVRLTAFIADTARRAGFARLIVGLSGGVDSALSAALGARAVGRENILGLLLPYKGSSPQSENDARETARVLGLATERIDITPMIDAYFDTTDASALRRGNKCARERMAILFDIASRDRRLVLGTSNKTEVALGYSTWFGDSACSLNPLGGLYKHEVREMAAHLGIPRAIIDKAPTADLWPDQTDEGELGLTYKMADDLLDLIIERGIVSLSALMAKTGADEATVKSVFSRINTYGFKRSLPATDLLGGRPIPETVKLIEP